MNNRIISRARKSNSSRRIAMRRVKQAQGIQELRANISALNKTSNELDRRIKTALTTSTQMSIGEQRVLEIDVANSVRQNRLLRSKLRKKILLEPSLKIRDELILIDIKLFGTGVDFIKLQQLEDYGRVRNGFYDACIERIKKKR